MYKIRFHLQRGRHYRHWQITDKQGNVKYYDPDNYQLIMHNCKLVSQPAASKRVYNSGVKDVCGWIKCEDIEFSKDIEVMGLQRILYNPIIDTEWHAEGVDGAITGSIINKIVSKYDKVYVNPN